MFNIKLVSRLTGHRGAIYKIIQAMEPGSFISGGGDGWVVNWCPSESSDGKLVAKDTDNIFTLLRYSDSHILAGTLQGNLLSIDIATGLARKIIHHKKGLYDLQIWNEEVISLGGDGKLTFWNAEKLLPSDTLQVSSKSLRRMAIHQKKGVGAVACSDGTIYLIDLTNKGIIDKVKNVHQGAVFSVAFNEEGNILYSGGQDAILHVWDLDLKTAIVKIPAHRFTVNDMALHRDGQILATASRDRSIKLWSVDHLELLKVIDYHRYATHMHSVNSIIWSQDGRQLISGSDDRTICVLDIFDEGRVEE